MISYYGLQTLWKLICERQRAANAAAFPETGGTCLFVHNWIICGPDTTRSNQAQAIRDKYRAQWTRIKARYERESARREHATHVSQGSDGQYLWCKRCVATTKAKAALLPSTEPTIKGFACEACNRTFGSLEAIGIHFDTNEHWLMANDPENPNLGWNEEED